MDDAILNDIKKPRGRPATGQGKLVAVRLDPETLDKLDRFRAEQDGNPTRPEAIRRVVKERLGKG